MKVPREPLWERLIARYLIASGMPVFRWDGKDKRFHGVRGFSWTRSNPTGNGGWANVPFYFKRYERERQNGNPHPVIMFLASKYNGENVEDTFVLMRLGTFAPLIKALIESDPARHIGEN